MMTHGYEALMGQDEDRAPGSAILGTKTILCQIGAYWYHCAGLPFQLYIIVFIAALVLLFLYITSCAFVLAWMFYPSFGSLSNVMEKFEMKFKKLNQEPNSHHELQWGLYSVYYNDWQHIIITHYVRRGHRGPERLSSDWRPRRSLAGCVVAECRDEAGALEGVAPLEDEAAGGRAVGRAGLVEAGRDTVGVAGQPARGVPGNNIVRLS